jgi:hypothetical protein
MLLGTAVFLTRKRSSGPPPSLILRGKFDSYAKVPEASRRTFFIDMKTKFRRTVARAFRNRGWRKTDNPAEAQFLWDKQVVEDRYEEQESWQRYNHIPGFSAWDEKDGFIRGFDKYRKANPDRELYMIPETYRLATKDGRDAFERRIFQNGGLHVPWVLKVPDINNGKGITMLAPNSKELKGILEEIKDSENDYIVQAYICNELTWWENRKFDLRFYWMVASIDPLIVLYHDGYVRVGNSEYDESDFSTTEKHLTTHTYLADEGKGTKEELRQLVRHHFKENYWELSSSIKIDPYEHVRNQLKASIAETVSAFRDVTFGGSKRQKLSAENAFSFYGNDFVLDNDLDAWYVESQAGPGLEEEFDFRVEMHRELLRGLIDIVEEIQLKLEEDPTASVLPLKNKGSWELVYAGTGDDFWMYEYEGYQRSKHKTGCDIHRKAPKSQPQQVRTNNEFMASRWV